MEEDLAMVMVVAITLDICDRGIARSMLFVVHPSPLGCQNMNSLFLMSWSLQPCLSLQECQIKSWLLYILKATINGHEYQHVNRWYESISMLLNCRTGVVFYLNPQPRLDPRKNQNGTIAEDALFMEKFISAESVR